MQSIWKFRVPLEQGARPEISMPEGAYVLTVQMQGDLPTIWAMVDPDAPRELRKFLIVGTGSAVPEGHLVTYIGTWQQLSHVFHLFQMEN